MATLAIIAAIRCAVHLVDAMLQVTDQTLVHATLDAPRQRQRAVRAPVSLPALVAMTALVTPPKLVLAYLTALSAEGESAPLSAFLELLPQQVHTLLAELDHTDKLRGQPQFHLRLRAAHAAQKKLSAYSADYGVLLDTLAGLIKMAVADYRPPAARRGVNAVLGVTDPDPLSAALATQLQPMRDALTALQVTVAAVAAAQPTRAPTSAPVPQSTRAPSRQPRLPLGMACLHCGQSGQVWPGPKALQPPQT